MNNPYPEKIQDEASGIIVRNIRHDIWQEGYNTRNDDMYEACLIALGSLVALDNGQGWVKQAMNTIQEALAKAEVK